MSRRVLFFGLPGSGKTVALVRECLLALKEGKIVYSNIKILWFGSLKKNTSFDNFVNAGVSLFLRFGYNGRVKRIAELNDKRQALFNKLENIKYYHIPGSDDRMPEFDITTVYRHIWQLGQRIRNNVNMQDVCDNGLLREHWHTHTNYRYCEELKDACEAIIHDAEADRNQEFVLCWDEGFIDLEHGSKVPRFITNFLNQTRKLNVDVLIASQRPVAVYPNFRALCDYMVNVERTWFGRFKARMYYVQNSANALPDLSKDAEGKDDSKHYDSWKGTDIFPYFDTHQSIGLKKIFKIK